MGILDRLRGRNRSSAPDVYREQHLAAGSAPQKIGEHSANEVFKVQYDPAYAMRGGETTGYFKPNDEDTAPHKYAVGASLLAQGMGWGDLIAETHFARHAVSRGGQPASKVSGAVSRAAPGETLLGGVKDDPTMDGYTGFEVNDIDLTRSTTQRQLNQLQWFDALLGNKDRHGGNILVDRETGRVTGIDNDLSFAKGYNAPNQYFEKGATDKFLGLPAQIDKATAKKLLRLNPKRLDKMLDPKKAAGMSFEQELPYLHQRLGRIQDEVRRQKEAGSLVKKWDAATYQAAVNEPAAGVQNSGRPYPRSYIQRQHQDLARARNPQDSQIWVRGDRQNTAPGSLPQPAGAPQPAPQPAGAPQAAGWAGARPSRPAAGRVNLPGARAAAGAPPPQPAPPGQPAVRPRSTARPSAPQRPTRPVRPAPRPPHPAAPGRPRAARPMRPAPKPPTAPSRRRL